MNRKIVWRILVAVVAVAVVAAVGIAAYNWGFSAGQNGTNVVVRGYRGPMMGVEHVGSGWLLGSGLGLLGLVCLFLLGLALVWLVVVAANPNRGASAASGAATGSGVEQLRELSEMRSRGELTEAEFKAAKSKLLGM
jgi:uncharacterized membrane protein